MRILLLNLEKGWRGGERQTLLTAVTLKQQGYDVSIVARAGQELAKRALAAGVEVATVANNLGLVLYLLFRARQFDIVHVQTAGALSIVALVKGLCRAKVVYTRRTSFPLKANKAARTLAKWRRVDAFVAISEAAAQEPLEHGIEVSIIPSAVEFVPPDMDEIIKFSDAYHLAGKYVIATSAALSAEKDPLTSIRAVHALWQKRQDFVFLHFGASGSESEAAQELIAELGLQEVYLLVGFVKNIEDMYRLMHVFVLSSKQEALGSSVLDAFLYESAVVATNAGGIPSLLADGRGVLCEVGDFAAIAVACDELLENATQRQQLVKTAESWVTEEHAVPLMVNRYLELYKSLT